jgi:hypothetical protein
MPTLKIKLRYDKSKFITRAIGINLEKLEIKPNDEAEADIEVRRTYYLTAHFVVNTADTSFTAQLIPPAGYRVRFPGYSKDAVPMITWTAGQTHRDYFESHRFYLREED